MIKSFESASGVPLYQLKIMLKWSKPPIWRRVIVRGDMSLDRLHWVIQLAMGWTNSHLHQYMLGRTCYGTPDPDSASMGMDILNEKRYTVADLAPAAKKKFIYEYDFGDGWQHEVVAEKILPPDSAFKPPVCLAGANACPPEDCGGMSGYYNLLATLADPKHPEHDELKEWVGGNLDPTRFDLHEANDGLKRFKA